MVYGDTIVFDGGELTLDVRVDGGELSISNTIEDGLQTFMPLMPDGYTGATTVTPTQGVQVLATEGLVVPTNIIINPIPSNYGLITWNGSTLTVS